MSKSIKLKNNKYWDSSAVAHKKISLKDVLNNLGFAQDSSQNSVTYSVTSSWTWKSVSNNITVNKDGYYLCLYTSWPSGTLGTEMDLRFTKNGGLRENGGNALGNKGIAMDIIRLAKGDVLGVSMQTSGTGTITINNPYIIIIKVSA